MFVNFETDRPQFVDRKEQVVSAINHLQRAKEINGEKYLYWHYLGLIYWSLGGTYKEDRKYSLHHFLQSAKWNPSFASNFTHLGQFYQDVNKTTFLQCIRGSTTNTTNKIEKDVEKAKRCYQKAISLDPLDAVASKQLSEMYLESGQVALAESILREITNHKPREHWAFLRLALLQLVLILYFSIYKKNCCLFIPKIDRNVTTTQTQ